MEPSDWLALVSVLASAGVAAFSISASRKGAEADRKHATELAERAEAAAERATLREALAELSEWIALARDVMQYPNESRWSHELPRPVRLDGQILRYAPAELRHALQAFDEAGADERFMITRAFRKSVTPRKAKEAAIDTGNFEEAARLRQVERDELAHAEPGMERLHAALTVVEDALRVALERPPGR